MSRWGGGGVDNGILRKRDRDAYDGRDRDKDKDDLLVFGYSCKIFLDEEKAVYVDQGKHLIPWMGDETLKIDRYDCRGNMGPAELSMAEAKVDRVNWLQLLSSEEQRAEKLCDEERYRALYTNEDEEEMYREEELKRLHMMARGSSYGQVQFNYDGDSVVGPAVQERAQEQQVEMEDEPYEPSMQLNVPEGMPVPATKKLNAIIEKTAAFISGQGVQMEILLKAKQAGNPQFEFLSLECPLHRYYMHVLQAIRERRYHPYQEEAPPEKLEEEDHYLHPSLAPVSVESAPSIPSIAYKPSADCAYSMLVNQIKGKDPKQESDATSTNQGSQEMDIAPPGTEMLPLPLIMQQQYQELNSFSKMTTEQLISYASYSFMSTMNADIAKGPVMYSKSNEEDLASTSVFMDAPSHISNVVTVKAPDKVELNVGNTVMPTASKSVTKPTGPVKLIHYSDSESESEDDMTAMKSFPNKPSVAQPPADQQLIIDKMASYVAKNGDAFEQIVKMKGDPRFSFLNPSHEYYPYYVNKRQFYEGVNRKESAGSPGDSNDGSDGKVKGPVSFSIKKIKEPEPILPKPALPYESTTDEEGSDNENSRDSLKTNEVPKEQLNTTTVSNGNKVNVNEETVSLSQHIQMPANPVIAALPIPVVVKSTPTVPIKPLPLIQPMPFLSKTSTTKATAAPTIINAKTIYHVQNDIQPIDKRIMFDKIVPSKNVERKRSRSKEKKIVKEKSPRLERRLSVEGNRDRRRKKICRRRSRSPKRRVADDVITVDDDEALDRGNYIDLTKDCKRDKTNVRDWNPISSIDPDDGDAHSERKRKAAAFLSTLKDIPTSQQQSSLVSAMVKTLHSYQSKMKEEERSRRRKSKKHKRSRSRSYSSESDRDDKRSSKYSRRHHKSCRHSKKSKKTSRDDDRFSKSKSSNNWKTSPREDVDSHSVRKVASSSKKIKTISEEDYKPKRHSDKLLMSSLKELVKETRQNDLIACEPIKMAVDLFSGKSVKRSKTGEDWERNSNRSSRRGSESGEITSSSSSLSSDEE